jgi:predicted SprT family Zn-dependent metalloprotease
LVFINVRKIPDDNTLENTLVHELIHFRLQILEKIGIYSSRFSIPEPKVLLTTKEVLDMPKEMTEGRRTSAYKYYGVSYLQHNLVFINVRKILDDKTLENTLVHELIHLRFPYLAHGKAI